MSYLLSVNDRRIGHRAHQGLDPLDFKPGPPDTPDDYFDASALDSKWTVTAGSAGTVTFPVTYSLGAIHDITTRKGWGLLIGCDSAAFAMRQDYTIPDNRSVITKWHATPYYNDSRFQFGINDNDTGPFSGTARSYGTEYDADSDGDWQGLITSGTGWGATYNGLGFYLGPTVYIRITRDNLTYTWHASGNHGADWFYLGAQTLGSASTNIWINVNNLAVNWNHPIVLEWVLEGDGTTYDPWPRRHGG